VSSIAQGMGVSARVGKAVVAKPLYVITMNVLQATDKSYAVHEA